MNAFGWAFIGSGKLAHIVARQLLPSGRHRIVSVYTRRWEKCQEFAGEVGALPARTAEEAILSPGVQGVYIVTPHTSHFESARLALRLGKPVLCEKPLTTDARQAAELIALAREKRVYFAEGMWTWFSPVAQQVKAWMDAGAFGEIQRAELTYHLYSIHYAPRLADPNLAGGALLDIGVYPITYLYRLFGNPARVTCQGTLKGGIDLKETVRLTFANGLTGTASISLVDYWGLERLALTGSKARATQWFFHSANAVTLRPRGGKAVHFRGDGSLRNEFDRAAEEILEGRTESQFVPHQATLDVMRMMDTCRQQMGLVYPFEK